jgi:preprotein translocase subunit YajC
LKTTSKLFAAAALSLATISGAAFAQAAKVTAGATVYDPQGGTVGTVDSVADGVAVVNTGAHTVALPLDKFATSEKGPVISVTKQQLDEIAAQADADAAAKLNAALVAGAAVVDNAGTALGTIDNVDGDNVVLKTEKGPVALTRKYFAVQNGALMALVTKDQILAALSAPAQS